MRRSGSRLALLVLLPLLLGGCLYGFAGGGLPQNIRTVAVIPFDNETPAPALQQELHERLRREVEGRLGLRAAAEPRADAIVRGRIVQYDVDIPVSYSADRETSTATRRRLRVTVDVEIVDQANNRTLWSRRGLAAEADYNERSEDDGRRQAVEKLVNEVIAGAQSQW
jgi:hypothetical protein